MIRFEEVFNGDEILKETKLMKSKSAVGGVDGMSLKELEGFFKKRSNREIVIKKLKRGTYKTHKSRVAFIKKKNGKRRKLMIQTAIDRLVMSIFQRKLRERYSSMFSDYAFTTKIGDGNLEAVKLYEQFYRDGYQYVMKVDIKSYFDNIPHEPLLKIMSELVDEYLLNVIKKFIHNNAGIGIQQGNPLSPFLCNYYLLEMDRRLEVQGITFIRYIDDITLLKKTPFEWSEYEHIREMLGEYEVEVSDEKLEIGHITGKKFLGYKLNEEEELDAHNDNILVFRDKINRILDPNRPIMLQDRLKKLSDLFIGWFGYYQLADTKELEAFYTNYINEKLKALQMNCSFLGQGIS